MTATKTLSFNTGRQYTPAGQLIHVISFEPEVDPDFEEYSFVPCWMYDTSRNICLSMELWIDTGSTPTEEDVMKVYDRGGPANDILSTELFNQEWAKATTFGRDA